MKAPCDMFIAGKGKRVKMSLILKRIFLVIRMRELLLGMTKGELKSRYRSAYFGFSWTLIQPLVMMITLYLVFSVVMKFNIRNYPVFLLAGLFPWTFTTSSLTSSSSSLWVFSDLVKKVYFPREVVVLSQILANGFNFAVSLVVLLVFMLFFPVKWSPWILLLPVVFLIHFSFTVGISLWGAALSVYFRDVQFLVNVSVLPWFYGTPIFYSMRMVPERFRLWLYLNPMTGIVEMYRSIFLEGVAPERVALVSSAVIAAVFFLSGAYLFGSREKNFADFV